MNARLSRQDIARAAAHDIPEGACVNLGIGLPTLIADYVPAGRELMLQSEQGLLGLGPAPAPGEEDYDVINAGKFPVTLLPGASVFSHSDSFMMIRGGHIQIACLGAFQVASNGDLANWTVDAPGQIPGVGGAMDLAAGAEKVWVLMEHCTKEGAPRILEQCTYPLTAPACVDRIYTDLAVIDVVESGLIVRRVADGWTLEALQAVTGAPLTLAPDCSAYRNPATQGE
ncbi:MULTISPECIES: 3-oxoacid CoA-transferase subunit B [Achromobacter]|uniref:3-oxoacid CoA-transferase subunit B n=1 Tax=Achromobacter spanius TaxID=217203 RepID=A0ABY8GR95_9BURK|nr:MULTISPECIES: 3-oxoacid CoA-transferase subunit B [Achromobacter]WAI83464.1 3-oxoacid CoA-transferase subunit B [Achromobacter spanius]WEX93548.1 3-oxoacid CoA-transferase subunit B [Achromobacter sp. SS2-2022]WFP07292.1 3-oxoacid CoA-transferase subunit B [Achromobacter spanius]